MFVSSFSCLFGNLLKRGLPTFAVNVRCYSTFLLLTTAPWKRLKKKRLCPTAKYYMCIQSLKLETIKNPSLHRTVALGDLFIWTQSHINHPAALNTHQQPHPWVKQSTTKTLFPSLCATFAKNYKAPKTMF